MPKIIPLSELDRLVEIIGRSPEGTDVQALLVAADSGVSRRTLQRRLADLIDQGRIKPQRAARSVQYRLTGNSGGSNVTMPAFQAEGSWEAYPFVSPEGEAIKAYVRQHISLRRPVGYRVEFLEAYQPNLTPYLPEQLRTQLHSMGRSPVDQSPAGTFARDICNRLLIDLSWASSRLEGNTYNRLDTARLIQFGEVAQGKNAIETQMILNHKAAIEYLVHDADHLVVTKDNILALHAMLSDGLLDDPMACGRLRQRAVEIGASVYLPVALPQRIEELFAIVLDMAAEIADPFEQAFFLMVHLPYLQPFEDVNKRVSRLAANIPLMRTNLSPLSFIGVLDRAYVDAMLGVYELNRVELLRDLFVGAYERSCQQYVAIRRQLVPPDTFRLRHRTALAEFVRAIVRGQLAPTAAAIRETMPGSVTPGDGDHFVQLVLDELKALNAANAIRFGLRPLEFEAWKERAKGG